MSENGQKFENEKEKSMTREQLLFVDIMKEYNEGNRQKAMSDAVEVLDAYIYSFIRGKYPTQTSHYEDMYHEGVRGIVMHLGEYNPYLATPTTFFSKHILHETQAYYDLMISGTKTHQASQVRKVRRAIRELESRGLPGTIEDIAVLTEMNVEQVEMSLNEIHSSNLYYYDADDTLEPIITEWNVSPEQKYVEKEKKEALYLALGRLDELESKIIILHYGLGCEQISYVDIAKKLNVSLDKVKKSANLALIKLKRDDGISHLNANRQHSENIIGENYVELIPVSKSEELMDALEDEENLEIINL